MIVSKSLQMLIQNQYFKFKQFSSFRLEKKNHFYKRRIKNFVLKALPNLPNGVLQKFLDKIWQDVINF